MATTNIVLSTDNTGANDPIFSGNNRIFNFSTTATYILDYALFTVKKGSSSTNGITATIYNAIDGGGSTVATVFLSAANISQTYTATQFNFSSYSLPAGTYSCVLSSTTASGGNSNYFIKSGNFQVLDSSTLTAISIGFGIQLLSVSNVTQTSKIVATKNLGVTTTSTTALITAPAAQKKLNASLLATSSFSTNVVATKNLIATFNNQTEQIASLGAVTYIAAGISVDAAIGATVISDVPLIAEIISAVEQMAALSIERYVDCNSTSEVTVLSALAQEHNINAVLESHSTLTASGDRTLNAELVVQSLLISNVVEEHNINLVLMTDSISLANIIQDNVVNILMSIESETNTSITTEVFITANLDNQADTISITTQDHAISSGGIKVESDLLVSLLQEQSLTASLSAESLVLYNLSGDAAIECTLLVDSLLTTPLIIDRPIIGNLIIACDLMLEVGRTVCLSSNILNQIVIECDLLVNREKIISATLTSNTIMRANIASIVTNVRGNINQRIQLEVNVDNKIIVPGCEPTSALSSRTLSAYMATGKYCHNALVDLQDALKAIPGSYIKYGVNFNKGVRQKWFVLPPNNYDCPCESNIDYYDILSKLPGEDHIEEQYDRCDMLGMGYCPSPDFDQVAAPAPSPYVQEGAFPTGGGVLPPIPPWVKG